MIPPLDGVRVLDAGTFLAAPYAASILGSLGADVVKIERMGGDSLRSLPPFVDGVSAGFTAVNHRKRFVAIELRHQRGQEILHELIRGADVLLHNARSGREATLGLDTKSCHDVNPRLVHGSITGFYPAHGDRPGYDILFQSESGLLDLTGEPDRPPSRIGASAIDHVSGLWLALGVLGALGGERDRASVRVSMLDVAVSLLSDRITAYTASEEVPHRMGGRISSTTPHGTFATADAYIVVGAATDHSFLHLAEVLGPPLAGDERFLTQRGRLEHRDEVERLVQSALLEHGADHWVEVLTRADVPVSRVYTLAEAVDRHRQLSETGLRPVSDVEPLEVLAPPLTFPGHRWDPVLGPENVGGDTAEVLAEAGFNEASIDALRSEGVIS